MYGGAVPLASLRQANAPTTPGIAHRWNCTVHYPALCVLAQDSAEAEPITDDQLKDWLSCTTGEKVQCLGTK